MMPGAPKPLMDTGLRANGGCELLMHDPAECEARPCRPDQPDGPRERDPGLATKVQGRRWLCDADIDATKDFASQGCTPHSDVHLVK
jgi:hypothetical protein